MNEQHEPTEPKAPEVFNLAEEFAVSDAMENGKRFPLSDTAWIKVRSRESKAWRKAWRKSIKKIPALQTNNERYRTRVLIDCMADYMLLDWDGVSLDGETVLPNTSEDRKAALKVENFRDLVWELASDRSQYTDDVPN